MHFDLGLLLRAWNAYLMQWDAENGQYLQKEFFILTNWDS